MPGIEPPSLLADCAESAPGSFGVESAKHCAAALPSAGVAEIAKKFDGMQSSGRSSARVWFTTVQPCSVPSPCRSTFPAPKPPSGKLHAARCSPAYVNGASSLLLRGGARCP